MAERAPDKDAYALCSVHHRTGTSEEHPSVHLRPEIFHARYGSDEYLTKLTRITVQRLLDNTIGRRA